MCACVCVCVPAHVETQNDISLFSCLDQLMYCLYTRSGGENMACTGARSASHSNTLHVFTLKGTSRECSTVCDRRTTCFEHSWDACICWTSVTIQYLPIPSYFFNVWIVCPWQGPKRLSLRIFHERTRRHTPILFQSSTAHNFRIGKPNRKTTESLTIPGYYCKPLLQVTPMHTTDRAGRRNYMEPGGYTVRPDCQRRMSVYCTDTRSLRLLVLSLYCPTPKVRAKNALPNNDKPLSGRDEVHAV